MSGEPLSAGPLSCRAGSPETATEAFHYVPKPVSVRIDPQVAHRHPGGVYVSSLRLGIYHCEIAWVDELAFE